MLQGETEGDVRIGTQDAEGRLNVNLNITKRDDLYWNLKHAEFLAFGLANGGKADDSFGSCRRHHLRRRKRQAHRPIGLAVNQPG